MPRPLHVTAPSQELRHFTNREKEQDILRCVLAHKPGTPLPVVMFFGVGGVGKSWLLRKLREQVPPLIPSALLDFEPRSGGTPFHTDSSRSLAYLRNQFHETECPQFDLAYAWLRYKEGIKDEPIFKGGGVAAAAIEALGELASGVLEGVPLVGKFLKKLANKVKKKTEDTRLERWLAEKAGQQDFLRLRGMSAQEIYPELARRLLADLADGLFEWVGHACRGVIFLDTVEALRVGTPGNAQGHERESWVRELVAPGSPLLLVLAGRDRLRWDEADPDFANPQLLEQHLVGGLSETDSRLFLTKCGVSGGPLQDAVLRVSADTETELEGGQERGFHPFSLGLAADAILMEQVRGLVTDPATFDFRPGDSARLAQRFLKSLADPAHEIWVKRLALTPRFDETAARTAHSDGHGVEQDAAWQGLLRYSFVRDTDEPGYHTLHTRMRDALAETSTASAGDHTFWERYWRGRSKADSDDWAGLAWYHQYRLDPNGARQVWNEMAKEKRRSRRMAEHYRLLAWWEPTGLLIGDGLSSVTAGMLINLAVELVEASLGNRSENIRKAIACYGLICRVYTEADFPQDWAGTQNNLGIAYKNLPTGDRGENLRRAIACYKAALRGRTEADFPQDWATTQNNLGNAYSDLPAGDRGENLRRAIACYETALRLHTEADFPQDWAMTQNNLGIAYSNLPTGDRGENLRRAIACCEAALRVHTETDFPQLWAMTQNNLGIAYRSLPAGDRGENLWRAIACYEAALRVHTEADFPQLWAMIQNNLGNAYWNLPTGDRGENLRRAITCYEAALRIRTEADFPQDWAVTQNNLGNAYSNLPAGDRGENLRRAIACYEAALRVHTEAGFPQQWAWIQNNLGIAYKNLPTGDRGENLRRAIACYEAALRARTEADFPQDWAMTQNNLGNAYSNLSAGDRDENLRRAIACYETALRGRTEADFPQDWATTQNNLGTAYSDLPAGDRGENQRRAIACYEAALRIHTEADFPQDWAMTQFNLGVAYRIRWRITTNAADGLLAASHYALAARGYAACGLEQKAANAQRRADQMSEELQRDINKPCG